MSIEISNDNSRFCVLPFIHMHVSNFGKASPCCINSYQLGDTKESTLQEIWNNSSYTEFRNSMKSGNGHSSCSGCYEKEKCGLDSLRTLSNNKFLVEHPVKNYNGLAPKYLDIRFSNICNFRCRSCWHGSSSSWYEDAVKLNSTAGSRPEISISEVGDILQQMEVYIDQIEEMYFAGGEPLIMREHYELLNMFITKKNMKVRLRYNTNFSNLNYKGFDLLTLWKKFENIELNVSIDETGEKFSYLRKGGDFNKLLENRLKIRDLCPHIKVRVNVTVSIFNVASLAKLIKYLKEIEFVDYSDISFNILEMPYYYNIKIFTDFQKEKIKTSLIEECALHQLPTHIREEFEAVINYMFSDDWSQKTGLLRGITEELDVMRKESFKEVFCDVPELLDLIVSDAR